MGYLVAGLVAMAFATAHGQAATTVCKDGSTSATTGRGACSGHGGVDAKATSAAAKTAKAAEKKAEKATKAAEKETAKATKAADKAADQVTCSDGTMSKGGRGACSGHGGIKGAATPAPAATAAKAPSLPAAVPAASPARAKSEAKSKAPTRASTNRGEDKDATDAIAQCKDGLYSHAANHQGACSKHGGVAKFLKP